MKQRPDGFLMNNKIDHKSEPFDYISELHDYLWRFVRCTLPAANGKLEDYLDFVIEHKEHIGKIKFPSLED